MTRLVTALAFLAAAAATACNSGPTEPTAPAEPVQAVDRDVPAIPNPLPSDPVEALNALLDLPYASHFGNPAQHRSSSQRILGAVDRAMRSAEDPARFVAVQAAAAVLAGAPTGGSYSALQREWRSLRSRLR